MVDVALNRFGRLDILINNAGPVGSFRLFEDTSAESSERVADIHYKGTVALCRAAWPHLAASGAGRIINTSSAAILGSESQTDYGSAKAAIFGFTRSLAIEGRRHGINVNCILPSAFTRMMETISDPLVRDSARPIMGCHRSAESKDGGF
jgi:NAD(P)-dependent dehydrogenase (short-subunit alcohol dehydrogenase family)